MLTVLAEAGFTGRQRDIANRSLMVYLVGSIQFEHFGQLSETGAAAMANLPWDHSRSSRKVPARRDARRPTRSFRRALTSSWTASKLY